MRYSRQDKILEIISENEIETQDALAEGPGGKRIRRDAGDDFQRYQRTSAYQNPVRERTLQIRPGAPGALGFRHRKPLS